MSTNAPASVPVIRQRRPMTEARLKANRENAKKGGRPRGSMNGDKLSLRERCRVRDEEHVRILEAIAADSTHPGFQLVAIRDLMDRGWGRPSQMVEGTGPGGAIPFTVVLPVAISSDDD